MGVQLKAGKYWIGDPCYMLSEENYQVYLDQYDRLFVDDLHGGEKNDGRVVIDGHEFAVFSTKFGDGCYLDQFKNLYSADSGMTGCLPIELVKEDVQGCHPVEFLEDFYCEGSDGTYGWSGILQFGRYIIETGDFEEDEYEE